MTVVVSVTVHREQLLLVRPVGADTHAVRKALLRLDFLMHHELHEDRNSDDGLGVQPGGSGFESRISLRDVRAGSPGNSSGNRCRGTPDSFVSRRNRSTLDCRHLFGSGGWRPDDFANRRIPDCGFELAGRWWEVLFGVHHGWTVRKCPAYGSRKGRGPVRRRYLLRHVRLFNASAREHAAGRPQTPSGRPPLS